MKCCRSVVLTLFAGTMLTQAQAPAAAQVATPAPPSVVAPANPVPAMGCAGATLNGLIESSGATQTTAERSADGRVFAIAASAAQLIAAVTVPASATATIAVDGSSAIPVSATGGATLSVAKVGFHHVVRLVSSDGLGNVCKTAYQVFSIDGIGLRPAFESATKLSFGDASAARQVTLSFMPSTGDDVVVDAVARIGPAAGYHAELASRFDTTQTAAVPITIRVVDQAGRDLVGLGGGTQFKNGCVGMPFVSGNTVNLNAPVPTDAPSVTYLGVELKCDQTPTLAIRASFALPILGLKSFAAALTVNGEGDFPRIDFADLHAADVTSGVSLVQISGARTSTDWVLAATLRFNTLGVTTQAPVVLNLKQKRFAFVATSPEQAIPIALDNGKLLLNVQRFECGPATQTVTTTQRATCSGTVAVTLPDFNGSFVSTTPLVVEFNADRAFTITTNANRSLTFGGKGLQTTLTLDSFRATFVNSTNYSISGQGSFGIERWTSRDAPATQAAGNVFKVSNFSIARTPDKPDPQIALRMSTQGTIAILKDILALDGLSANFSTDAQGLKIIAFSGGNVRIGNLTATELKDFAFSVRGVAGEIRLDGSVPKFDFSNVVVDSASGSLLDRQILGSCDKEPTADGKLPQIFKQNFDTARRPTYELCVGARVMEAGSVIGVHDKVNADLLLSFNDAKGHYDIERAELSMPPKASPFTVRLASRTMSVSAVDVDYSRNQVSLLPLGPDNKPALPRWVATDGMCEPYLRGSMTISADAVLSSSKTSSLSPEVWFGKKCMFGEAEGLVFIEMGTNASATLRSVRFAVTPLKSNPEKTMVHVDAAGDLYIQSAVVSFNSLGFHSGEKLVPLHSVNIPSTVQNNIVRNFSALAGLLGGFLGRIIFH